MTGETSVAAPRGRPRRHSPEAEIGLILDAALEVMRRNRYADSSIREILAESGVGTRAFYRHFQSKDDLLQAVYRRDAESFARRVARAAASAPGPAAAVEACMTEYLAIFYLPRWAERARAITAANRASRATGDGDEHLARRIITAPLASALRAGAADGLLSSPDPDLDAASLWGMVASVGMLPPAERPPTLAAATAHCRRYWTPALGLD